MRSLHARLTAHGVSFGHWTFLRILWLQDGLTQRELSHLAGVMEPTTLTAVRAMQDMGMVERRQLDGNRKNMHVFLTESGRALEKVLVPLAEDVNRISVGDASERHVATTRRVLLSMQRAHLCAANVSYQMSQTIIWDGLSPMAKHVRNGGNSGRHVR
jgi:DNA-binding MarR family transcriptional regulator